MAVKVLKLAFCNLRSEKEGCVQVLSPSKFLASTQSYCQDCFTKAKVLRMPSALHDDMKVSKGQNCPSDHFAVANVPESVFGPVISAPQSSPECPRKCPGNFRGIENCCGSCRGVSGMELRGLEHPPASLATAHACSLNSPSSAS